MITPNKDYVAIELIEKSKTTPSGIILKSSDPTEVNRGRVVAIGKDVTLIKLNDIVLPNWNANKGKVMDEDIELWIIPESEIVAVFDPE
jgi:co-chaperonin GroES (HSP10)